MLRLHEEYNFLYNLLHADEPMIPLTASESLYLQTTPICHICEQTFLDSDVRIADHCHYRGTFLGAAHNQCNLERRVDSRLRIVMHNFQSYDCHMFIKELCKHEDRLHDVQIIPRTLEKYTSVSTRKFVMIDSCQHMPTSLEKLVENLTENGQKSDDLHYLKNYIKNEHNGNLEKLQLLLRKQVCTLFYI